MPATTSRPTRKYAFFPSDWRLPGGVTDWSLAAMTCSDPSYSLDQWQLSLQWICCCSASDSNVRKWLFHFSPLINKHSPILRLKLGSKQISLQISACVTLQLNVSTKGVKLTTSDDDWWIEDRNTFQSFHTNFSSFFKNYCKEPKTAFLFN